MPWPARAGGPGMTEDSMSLQADPNVRRVTWFTSESVGFMTSIARAA